MFTVTTGTLTFIFVAMCKMNAKTTTIRSQNSAISRCIGLVSIFVYSVTKTGHNSATPTFPLTVCSEDK